MTVYQKQPSLIEASIEETNNAVKLYYDTSSSASKPFSVFHGIILSFLLVAFVSCILYKPSYLGSSIVIIFLIIQGLKFIIFTLDFIRPAKSFSSNKLLSNKKLPIYTVIVPLYREVKVIPYLLNAIYNLDYPKKKLDIIFAVEADDNKTIAALLKETLNSKGYSIRIISVPDIKPRTKPKALNVVLSYIRGKYFVVYDAEDRPEPLQLKKSATGFDQMDKKVIALQARLTFYNFKRNLITKMFTLEYDCWFHLYLSGLCRLGFAIPLAGTSTHFRTDVLKEFGGWDSFNVTEDCDLGMRIAKAGLETKMLDSDTFEEAPIYPIMWLKQRTRWMKGYLQSYFVHSKSLRDIKEFGVYKFIGFNIVVLGQYIAAFLHPVLLGIFFYSIYNDTYSLDTIFDPSLKPILILLLTIGTFLPVFQSALIYGRLKQKKSLIIFSFCHPIYWLAATLASYRALWQLLTCPFYWEKTEHGIDT